VWVVDVLKNGPIVKAIYRKNMYARERYSRTSFDLRGPARKAYYLYSETATYISAVEKKRKQYGRQVRTELRIQSTDWGGNMREKKSNSVSLTQRVGKTGTKG